MKSLAKTTHLESPQQIREDCSVCKDLLIHLKQFLDLIASAHTTHRSQNWLTVEEVADELRISRSIVYRLIRNGELEAINIVEAGGRYTRKGHYRIERKNLQNYLDSKKTSPTQRHSQNHSFRRQFPKVKNHLGL
jgi:excisionase family DNA binding protein